MKLFFFFFSILLFFGGVSSAQNPVVDTHPASTIYLFDNQTNQESLATSDDAIVFKNALINLVVNTNTVRSQVIMAPGKKSFIITQADPATGNSFQITYQTVFLKQANDIYTFLYNADKNTLYFLNNDTQQWQTELIQGVNVVNLNNCHALSNFTLAAQPVQNVNNQPVADAQQDNVPLDTSASTTVTPPALPDYQQPECPYDGYLWQPGFWAYSRYNNDYYWVPGAWVAPPNPGLLWTPPYWGYEGRFYVFHQGYWGNTIGFYGGINYGYGYHGSGFVGGEWRDGRFRYNTAVVRVNVTIVHNTYVDNNVVYRGPVNHYGYNGQGGAIARPSERDRVAMHENHYFATSEQIRNQQIAQQDKSQFSSANNGRPSNFAVDKVPARNTNANQGFRAQGNQGQGNTQTARPGMSAPANNTGFRPNPTGSNTPGVQPGTTRPAVTSAGQPPVPGQKPGTPPVPGQRPGVPAGTNNRGKTNNPPPKNNRPENKKN